MKKTVYFYSLLMAIVMMAMSPTKSWAQAPIQVSTAEGLAAAINNNTTVSIQLTADFNINDQIQIPSSKNITIDLNSHTITSVGDGDAVVFIVEGSTLTITNGTITGSMVAGVCTSSTLNLSNCTLSSSSVHGCLFLSNNLSTLNIGNNTHILCTSDQAEHAIESYGYININGTCSITPSSSATAMFVSVVGLLNLNNCNLVDEDNNPINVEGCTIGAQGQTIYAVSQMCPEGQHTMEHHAATSATCTQSGNIEYWHCTNCFCNFSDADGQNLLTNNEWVIPALGHDLDADGHCASCGKTMMTGTILDINTTAAPIYIYSDHVSFADGTPNLYYTGNLIITGTSSGKSNMITLNHAPANGKIVMRDLNASISGPVFNNLSGNTAYIYIEDNVVLGSNTYVFLMGNLSITGPGNLTLKNTNDPITNCDDVNIDIEGDLVENCKSSGLSSLYGISGTKNIKANTITITQESNAPFSRIEVTSLQATGDIVIETCSVEGFNSTVTNQIYLFNNITSTSGNIYFRCAIGKPIEYCGVKAGQAKPSPSNSAPFGNYNIRIEHVNDGFVTYYHQLPDNPAVQNYNGSEVYKENIASMTFEDGTEYDGDYAGETVAELTYQRTFSESQVGKWQALYVPFRFPIAKLNEAGFDVAAINNFHEYTDENGALIRTDLEIKKLTSGTLKENWPYLIRPNSAGDKEIVLQDVVLASASENDIYCSSVEREYCFSGIYSPWTKLLDAPFDIYFLSGGTLCTASSNDQVLKAQRWYMTISDYGDQLAHDDDSGDDGGGPICVIGLRVIGEDDATGIEEIRVVTTKADKNTSTGIYDIQGRKVSAPVKGINIIRQSDGSVRKVMVK